MNIAVAGLGLIGGSFLKASEAAGHSVKAYHHGDRPDLSFADIVIVAQPPGAIAPWIRANEAAFKEGAIVVDVCGVKTPLYREFRNSGMGPGARKWHFVPGHPMAGKEVGGFANSTPDLFKGASMILTPYPYSGRAPLDALERYFRSIGFARVVYTTPERHDEMIAFTSQLCHIISSAYVREGLAKDSAGFTAGSFKDMVRVGAPDPEVWTELFFENRRPLLEVLSRYIARLESFRDALENGSPQALKAGLQEGVIAKKAISK